MPQQHKLFKRLRTPTPLVLYAIYLYLSGLSTRQVERVLKSLGAGRSREAVRQWVHRFGQLSLKLLAPKASEGVAVVDETCVKLGGEQA